jgi:hypothetical protein
LVYIWRPCWLLHNGHHRMMHSPAPLLNGHVAHSVVSMLLILVVVLIAGFYLILSRRGAFTRAPITTLTNEATILIDAIQLYKQRNGQYPRELASVFPYLEAQYAGTVDSNRSLWKGWYYEYGNTNAYVLYKFTGRLRQTILYGNTFGDTQEGFFWYIEDEDSRPKRLE